MTAPKLSEARRALDKGASNPRLQCAACGRWMRIHGIDRDGRAFQRFHGSCGITGGDHPYDGDVCFECCPDKCAAILGCVAVTSSGETKCDRCEALWARPANETGFRPTICKARATLKKLSEGQRLLLKKIEFDSLISGAIIPDSNNRRALKRLKFIEPSPRNPLISQYRKRRWRITPAGRQALKETRA